MLMLMLTYANLETGSNNIVALQGRDKKGWTQGVGLANVSPKGLYHGIRGWFKLERGS